MKIVIVGCGRVGSTLAENLDADGHEVIIFDIKTSSFDRLPETFKGAAIRGNGTDVDVLRRSGAQGADIFLALTEEITATSWPRRSPLSLSGSRR